MLLQVLLLFFVGQVRENGLRDKRLATGSNKLQNGKTSKTMQAGSIHAHHLIVGLSCLHIKFCRAPAISRYPTPAMSTQLIPGNTVHIHKQPAHLLQV